MLDGNSPDVSYSSLGQGGGETLPITKKPVAPEVDPMAHATKLEGSNPADKFDEAKLLEALGLPEKNPVTPPVAVKETKKSHSLFKKKEQTEKAKVTINQSQGFLMPFVNWINGVGNAVWKIATSWIPMKQTGTGTA
jgi:hypothetical protein